jgi:hypothetical protein
MLALSHNAALAAGVSAGTLIENTAVASYDDGAGPRTINSNTVTVRVCPSSEHSAQHGA